jgi:hypothetical protein
VRSRWIFKHSAISAARRAGVAEGEGATAEPISSIAVVPFERGMDFASFDKPALAAYFIELVPLDPKS